VMSWFAYHPAIIYTDSQYYLDNTGPLDPQFLDPIGYPLLILRPLLPLGGVATVAAVQHVVGALMGLAIYLLARRLGARNWLAALGAAPVLIDAYQIQIEENIMSDLWLQALLVATLWVLLAKGVPNWRRAALAGLLIGLAMSVRMVSLPLIVPAVVYVVLAGRHWRLPGGWKKIAARTGALAGVFLVVVGGYATYFHAKSGMWGLNTASGNSIYGATAQIADCPKLNLDATLQQLCPKEPLDQRLGPDVYAHADGTPGWPGKVPPGQTIYSLEHQFALKVIKAQPLDFARSVAGNFLMGFNPTHESRHVDPLVYFWQFQTYYPIYSAPGQSFDSAVDVAEHYATTYGGQPFNANVGLATFLQDYQLGGGWTPGPLLALCLLLGLVGMFVRRKSGLRMASFLISSFAVVLLGTAALFEFSWRYQLPGLVLLPLAGVVGMTALIGPGKQAAARKKKLLAPFPDDVDAAAMADFETRYGSPKFAPVLVVIAAYNEEAGIGGVLDNLPEKCAGLDVNVLVVVDGCKDRTAEVAREHGAFVCECPSNRGQGGALRLGYRLANYGGARYVITTDADGQYDNSEMPLLLEPLVADRADFVTGSRRLGVAPGDDKVRWLGVHVFATLASVLTGKHITDTSFGFRGMKAALAGSVHLQQPQYQASELLLSVLAGGARYLEQPMTMRVRSAGTTKKGNNFVYGRNYAKVMTRTWVREFPLRWLTRRPAAARQAAPVLDD
jgi:Glycosyl transferase family 2/Dolichyl-phosphate-mannose-protein mannosyltransferase